MSKKTANRSIYVEGHRFLIDMCKQLITEPTLWCVYDDEPLRKEKQVYKPNDPTQQAKLRAFAHLHLNMFEIMLNEAPSPRAGVKKNASNIWYQYFEDTLCRSQLMRDILDEPISKRIWSESLLKEYERWKDSYLPDNVDTQQPPDKK